VQEKHFQIRGQMNGGIENSIKKTNHISETVSYTAKVTINHE